MAEFCLDCWNEINGTNDPARKYIFSKGMDLCEGCGKWTHVVITERKQYYLRKFRVILFPFKCIYLVLYVLWRLLIMPYLIYKLVKAKRKRQIHNHLENE